MVVRVEITDDENIFVENGNYTFKSADQNFIDELMKFQCFVRFTKFIDNNKGNYEEIADSSIKPDLVLDLRDDFKNKISSFDVPFEILMDFDKYIAATPHLDMYGNQQ